MYFKDGLSDIMSPKKLQDCGSFFYIIKQSIGFILFFLIVIFFSFIKKSFLFKNAHIFFLCSIILCILPHAPIIGIILNGARRWIHCGFFIAQPVELLKPFFILFFAKFCIKQYYQPHIIFMGFIITSLVIGIILLSQPDFGQMIIILTTGFLMLISLQNNLKKDLTLSCISV